MAESNNYAKVNKGGRASPYNRVMNSLTKRDYPSTGVTAEADLWAGRTTYAPKGKDPFRSPVYKKGDKL